MGLRGQGHHGTRGYAMAALLVAIAVMAVLMSAALPVWRHEVQREKETELVWRGQQYVRAIRLYQARTQAFPPSIDVLVQGRFLRKKFKDPITDDDFQVLSAASPTPGQGGQTQNLPGQPSQAMQSAQQPIVGGIIGVVSKSKAESIRVYQGRTHYNEWTFLFVTQAPGRGNFPGGRPGQPGRPGGPGGRGQGEGGFPGRGTFPGGRGIGPGAGGQPPFPGRRGGGL